MSQEESNNKQTVKIISNKKKEVLLNTIGEIYSYSEEKLGKPIKPSELRIILNHNYNFERKSNDFSFDIKGNSFDPERDINKNEKLFKPKNEDFNLLNEYSKKNLDVIKNVDLTPQLKKGIIFQPKYFDFFQIKEEKKKIKYEFKNRIKDDIFFYSKNCKINILYKIKEYIDYIGQNPFFLENIGTIYQIFYLESMSDFENYQNLIQKKIIDYFLTNPEKFQIVFLLNNSNENKPMNVFNTYDKNCDLYYFIVDSSNKIVSVKPLTNFYDTIEKYFNKIKDQNQKDEDIEIILNLRKFSKQYYIHNFKFSYEIKIKIDDDLLSIIPKKVLNMKIEGELRTKQFKYLNKLAKKNKKYHIDVKELETFNIDINFSNIKCSNCEKEITENEGMYYCFWCDIEFCENCFENKLIFENYQNERSHFKDRLIHKEHNLLYFKTRNKKDLEDLDKVKLGSNKFASADVSLISYHHSAICNGCSNHGFENNDKKVRYICVTCRPGKKISGGYIDYCFICFDNMRKDNNDGRYIQNIVDHNTYNVNPNIVHKHNHNKHVYLVLTCEVDNKYEIY